MDQELKDALEQLKQDVKGSNAQEVKSAIDALEEKYKETLAEEVKSVKDEFAEELKKLQEHADALDVKLQEKSKRRDLAILTAIEKRKSKEIHFSYHVLLSKQYEYIYKR